MKSSIIVSVVVIVLAAFYLKSMMSHGDIADIDKMGSGMTTESTDKKTQPVDAVAADAKSVEAAPADAKSVDAAPADAKPVEAAPADAKPVEAADAKPVETAPADAKAVESAPADAPQDGIKPVEEAAEPEGKTVDQT